MPVSNNSNNNNEASRKRKANGLEEDGDDNHMEEKQEEAHEEEESDGKSWTGDDIDEDEDANDDRMLDNQQQPKVSLPSHGGADRKSPLWKLDPEESFSDWTIHITREGGGGESQRQTRQQEKQVDVYHVHRTILTCGLLQSDYFRMLFQSNFCETKSNTSRIPLVAPARKAFPLFLNLLYHPISEMKDVATILKETEEQPDYLIMKDDEDSETKSSNSNVQSAWSWHEPYPPSSYRNNLVALLYLADFFQTTQLHDAIFEAIQEEHSTLPSLYKKAAIDFSPPVQIVVDHLQDYCAKNILGHAASTNESFWNIFSVEFIIAVVSSEHHLIKGRKVRLMNQNNVQTYVYSGLLTDPRRSKYLSLVVANYCWKHSQQQQKQKQSGPDDINSLVTPETFRILTQTDYLPHILADSTAGKLLQLEKYYHDFEAKASTSAMAVATPSPPNGEDVELTCLQKRCLDALLDSPYWIDTSDPSDETLEIIKSSKTLLSASAIVDFMSKLCNKKLDKVQKLAAKHRREKDTLQSEMKRIKLLPAREALTIGINDDEDGDDPRFIKPVHLCAPEKFLPKHLHNGRDHTDDGRCPGHVLTKDRKRVLFTYEPQEEEDAAQENDDDAEEEEDSDSDNDEEEEEEDNNDYYEHEDEDLGSDSGDDDDEE